MQGSVNYQPSTQPSRPAQVGDRLQVVGEGIQTGNRSSSSLRLDSEIGTVSVSQNTDLRVQRLQVLTNGGRISVLSVLKGQARLRLRPFNNPDSRLEIETPAGVAGVRGTEFGLSVTETGKTAIATLTGLVEASAQGETVQIEPGFASIIIPGQPPTPPFPYTDEVRLQRVRLWRTSLGTLVVSGQVAPTNLVWINEQAVEPGIDGKFRASVPFPYRFSVSIQVQSPLGKLQSYRLQVP